MQISSADYLHGGTQKDSYTEADVETCACPLCGATENIFLHRERGALGVVRSAWCVARRAD